MVQILPQEQSLGGLLGAGVGQGIQTGLSEKIKQFQTMQKQQKSAEGLAKMFPEHPEYAEAFKQIPYELHPNLLTLLQKSTQGMTPYQQQKLDIAKEAQKEKKIKDMNFISEPKAQSMLKSLKHLEDKIPYTGSTKIPFTKSWNAPETIKNKEGEIIGYKPGLNRKALQERSDFDTTITQMVSFIKEQEAKGNLPKGIFADIRNRLPNSELPERVNRGRINAIKQRIENELKIRQDFIANMESKGKEEEEAQQNWQVGQSFESLPKIAPEGAIMRKGNQRVIFKNNKWSLL